MRKSVFLSRTTASPLDMPGDRTIRSRARKSVALRHANNPPSCERAYGHSSLRAKLKKLTILPYHSSITPVCGVRSRQLPLSATALHTKRCLSHWPFLMPAIPSRSTENGEVFPRRRRGFFLRISAALVRQAKPDFSIGLKGDRHDN